MKTTTTETTMFIVIEDRGYGIEYSVRYTNNKYAALELAAELNNKALNNPHLWNGNQDPFTYKVEMC